MSAKPKELPAGRRPAASAGRSGSFLVSAGLAITALALAPGVPPGSAPSLHAQAPDEPVLEGRVVQGGGSEPLPGSTVVLHLVARETAGSVDSTRAGPAGEFRLRLPTLPREGEGPVYFASVRHQGVLYFGSPVETAESLDSLYRIQVYDTTAAPPDGVALPVSARNVLMEQVEGEWRVVDLFQLRNPGDRTFVASEGGTVWRYPIPPEARDPEVGRSDLPPDAVTFEDGGIRVAAPLPPGERTYLIRYTVPEPALTIPLPGATEHFELLIREPAPEISVTGAQPAQPVEIEPGSNYRRFSAAEVQNHVVEVGAGGPGGDIPVAWVAVALSLVLAAAGIYAVKREPSVEPSGAGDGALTRREILLRIAELDEAHERRGADSGSEEERYREERRRLKARLRELE